MRVRDTDDFWRCIRQLEGKTVCTLVQHRPNKIVKVTDHEVLIEGRASRPRREDISCVYRCLCEKGRVVARELYGPNSLIGHPQARRAGRIILAIVAHAFPDEIEVVGGGGAEEQSGIRLKAL